MSRISYPVFSPTAGIKLDAPDQFLNAQYSAEGSQNLEYYEGYLRSRLGLQKAMSDDMGGAVTGLFTFQDLDRTLYRIACTTTDIFELDFGNDKPLYRTPTYATGTANFTNGSKTVSGNGTLWNTSSNVEAGDFIRLGTVNSGDFADQVWYEIDTVGNDTQITLVNNYAEATLATQVYCVRKVFTGGTTNYWSAASFTDASLGRIKVFTNGVAADPIVYWTGSNQCVSLGLSIQAKYLVAVNDYLFFAWCIISGNNQPHAVQWCDAGDATTVGAASIEYLLDTEGEIMGAKRIGDYAVIGKESSIYLGRYVGGDYVFDFQPKQLSHGILSPWSIVEANNGIYFYGEDTRFHFWDGVNDIPISDPILPFTKQFDPNGQRYTYGVNYKSKKQIRWFCAVGQSTFNYVIVFNYDPLAISWHIWKYEGSGHLGVPGQFETAASLFVDDATWGSYYVDEHIGYWDDQDFLANAALPYYGSTDGYLRRADIGTDDDGTNITTIFHSSQMDYAMPDKTKRFHRIEPWLRTQGSGDVTYRMQRDDSNSFGVTKTFSMIEASKDVTKPSAVLDVRAHSVTHEFRTTDHLELLGWFTYFSPAKRRVI